MPQEGQRRQVCIYCGGNSDAPTSCWIPQPPPVPCEHHDSRQRRCTIPSSSPPTWLCHCLPSQKLHNISQPVATENYLSETESLAVGLIRLSSSPVGAGSFFVEKKDKTLQSCIDYRGFNDITVKKKCPLPLIYSAFSLLHDSTIFSQIRLKKHLPFGSHLGGGQVENHI